MSDEAVNAVENGDNVEKTENVTEVSEFYKNKKKNEF